MPAKAPFKPQARELVYGTSKPPPKLAALLDDPVLCSKVAASWSSIREVIIAVMFDLPAFCHKEHLDASATVLSANKILTTLEVFKDQADMDRQQANRKPNQ